MNIVSWFVPEIVALITGGLEGVLETMLQVKSAQALGDRAILTSVTLGLRPKGGCKIITLDGWTKLCNL